MVSGQLMAGTVTPLHYDQPHNLYVQLTGRKKFVLFPRSQRQRLYLPSKLRLNHFSPVDLEAPDLKRFPKFERARRVEGELGPGEVLFLPRKWVHYVRSLEASIALNYWWYPWRILLQRRQQEAAAKTENPSI